MALSRSGEVRPSAPRHSMGEFASGMVFGAGLLASGVYSPNIIKAQMSFRSNTMLIVMMGASASSAIVQDVGDRLKLLPKKYPPPSSMGLFPYDTNVVGGTLIGLGMAITGSCPGTSLVQLGVGMAQGAVVLAGGVLGAMAFVRLQPALEDRQQVPQTIENTPSSDETPIAPSSKPSDLATVLGVPPVALLLVWIPLCLVVMRFAFLQDGTVRLVPQDAMVRPVHGGLLIGVAQLTTAVFAGHTIGASGAYEDVARWLMGKGTLKSDRPTSFLTPSLVFSSGVVASATVLSHFLKKSGALNSVAPVSFGVRSAALAVLGGMSMGFGSRLAKGCTSGHGISGLARFSIASLITTAALFSSGILTTGVLAKVGA